MATLFHNAGLERHGAAELGVLGLPHLAHAALSEPFEDLVVADRPADHDAQIVLLCGHAALRAAWRRRLRRPRGVRDHAAAGASNGAPPLDGGRVDRSGTAAPVTFVYTDSEQDGLRSATEQLDPPPSVPLSVAELFVPDWTEWSTLQPELEIGRRAPLGLLVSPPR